MLRCELVSSTVRRAFAGCFVVASCFIVGCGGASDDLPTGTVTGKVTANGSPVTGGSITFAPTGKGGMPAAGEVSSDGTYSLSTYGKNDGAVIGKHLVSYSPPVTISTEEPPAGEAPVKEPPKSPYDGFTPKTSEVEVKSGKNTIDIELAGPAGAAKR